MGTSFNQSNHVLSPPGTGALPTRGGETHSRYLDRKGSSCFPLPASLAPDCACHLWSHSGLTFPGLQLRSQRDHFSTGTVPATDATRHPLHQIGTAFSTLT